MKAKTDIVLVIEKCYREYCETVGDGPCGCDACPYSSFNTEEESGCFGAYKRDKLKIFTS